MVLTTVVGGIAGVLIIAVVTVVALAIIIYSLHQLKKEENRSKELEQNVIKTNEDLIKKLEYSDSYDFFIGTIITNKRNSGSDRAPSLPDYEPPPLSPPPPRVEEKMSPKWILGALITILFGQNKTEGEKRLDHTRSLNTENERLNQELEAREEAGEKVLSNHLEDQLEDLAKDLQVMGKNLEDLSRPTN